MTLYSRRQLTSVLISAFLWAALVLIFMYVPLTAGVEEPVYHEIRIQLAPLEEKPEAAPAPVVEAVPGPEMVPAAEPVIETSPAVEEVVIAPVKAEAPAPSAPKAAGPAASKKEEPAPAPAAKSPVPAPEPAKQTLVKSVDQLMAEQAAARGSKKNAEEIDWDSVFGESSTATSSVSTGEKNFVAQKGPSTSGQAAASASDTGMSAAATTGKATTDAVSEGTAGALAGIATASASAGSGNIAAVSGTGEGNGSSVSTGTGTAAGDGLEWGSGGGRKLKYPSKPEITFTEEQKTLITASVRDIRISFLVRADGTVLRDSILIDKKAGLPAQISQEIERQISEWFFEAGKSDGQAVFVYSIIKE